MTKKSLYQRLGGFDQDIFMYMEEVDLLYRAKKKGWKTYFYPAAQIVHLGSASSDGKIFPILQVYRGFLYFYKKHYSFLHLLILKFFLKLKAGTSLLIGRAINNQYLIKTYEEAFKIP